MLKIKRIGKSAAKRIQNLIPFYFGVALKKILNLYMKVQRLNILIYEKHF